MRGIVHVLVPRLVVPLLLVTAACAHPSLPTSTGTRAITESMAPGVHDRVINSVRLSYRIAGNGAATSPPVLFLHGGPGYNSHSFATLAGVRLEPGASLIYLDQRGCGRSERPWNGDYALATLVDDLEALRKELGLERWVLMGHSFGGTLALEYAARFPGHVAGLVLVGAFSDAESSFGGWERALEERLSVRTAAAGEGAEPGAHGRVMKALQGVDVAAFFNGLQFHDDRFRQAQDAVDGQSGLRNTGELSNALFAGVLATYRFSAFERIRAPALVIAGRHDRAIGLSSQRELAARLPRATWREFEASAHFPYLEEPERFTREVLDFVSALE